MAYTKNHLEFASSDLSQDKFLDQVDLLSIQVQDRTFAD